jgi:hypothetical protein
MALATVELDKGLEEKNVDRGKEKPGQIWI